MSTLKLPLRFALLPEQEPTVVRLQMGFALLPLPPDVFVWGLTGQREAVARRAWDGTKWYP
jgi:hypothetical protein